jgi:Flp pilus assembly protein TadD
MGGFKCLERLKSNDELLDAFSHIQPIFNTFPPLHLEKCRVFLNTADYDNASDYIKNKVTTIKHFEIYKILAICNLLNEGDFINALVNINKMWELLITQEPKNPELYYHNAMLFSRISDKRIDIIKKCEQMIDRALEYAPKNAKYMIEKANYLTINQEVEKAFKLYTQASELDSNNKESSYGLIYCKLLFNKLDEAQENINFLKEIFNSVKMPIHPKLKYFEALIKQIKNEKEETVGALISEALNDHVKLARQQIFTKYDILIVTDFDFLFDLAKCKIILILVLLCNYSLGTAVQAQSIPPNITRAQKILELINKNKYFVSANLLYIKLKFILEDKQNALEMVSRILSYDKNHFDANLLQAYILADLGDARNAMNTITNIQISNLQKIKEHVYFHIIKAKCELANNDTDNAQKTLNEALKLFDKNIADKNICKINLTIVKGDFIFRLQQKDKINLIKLNIDILLKMGKTDEAQKLINQLIGEMSDSNMGDDVLILNSDLALKNGDIKKAVNLLKVSKYLTFRKFLLKMKQCISNLGLN